MKIRISRFVWMIAAAVLVLLGLWLWWRTLGPTPQKPTPLSQPVYTAGIRVDTLYTDTVTIQNGDQISGLFENLGLGYPLVNYLDSQPDSVFNARQLRSGQQCLILRDSSEGPILYWLLIKNRVETLVMDLRDSLPRTYLHRKPVTTRYRPLVGTIQSSLYQSVTDAGAGPELAMALAATFDWTVDFFQLQKGDGYRVYYVESLVDSQPFGPAQIMAAEFRASGKTHTAIRFRNNYFDDKGQSMKRRYLKAPLDYTRISSGFSTSRLHPVLRYLRPHLGVDYAAPKGTPVRSVGDGQVLEAAYRGGNGNFVKIQHSREHATGYLHLSRIASGVRRGGRVRQGQVIGYVGSTGLSTGPHLCFRFWNRGVQVNPKRLQGPQAEPMNPADLPSFRQHRDSLMVQLPPWS